jgi:imidazole glycerol-phosphate synthase subunit HisH
MAKPRTVIIDYQMGNLFSVQHACVATGLDARIASDPAEILAADAAILPGVGAFGAAMENLEKLGLVSPIKDFIASGRPFMGICLGLQLLFSESEEFGSHRGLDLIPGRVRRFPAQDPAGTALRVPQIGWNQIHPPVSRPAAWAGTPLEGVKPGEFMYFVHSYYVEPEDPGTALSLTRYEGLEYCSSVRRKNIFASQFHPEKSAAEGLKIYAAWAAGINQKERTET